MRVFTADTYILLTLEFKEQLNFRIKESTGRLCDTNFKFLKTKLTMNGQYIILWTNYMNCIMI